MEEEKIEVTKGQLAKAMANIFVNGKLKDITKEIPTFLLLIPIIGRELWEELSKEKEEE